MVSGAIKNNGHAPTLTIDKLKGKAKLTGGPLGYSVFMLQQFHFHFGCDYDAGSEHLVNGKPYPGEVRNSSSLFVCHTLALRPLTENICDKLFLSLTGA